MITASWPYPYKILRDYRNRIGPKHYVRCMVNPVKIILHRIISVVRSSLYHFNTEVFTSHDEEE